MESLVPPPLPQTATETSDDTEENTNGEGLVEAEEQLQK